MTSSCISASWCRALLAAASPLLPPCLHNDGLNPHTEHFLLKAASVGHFVQATRKAANTLDQKKKSIKNKIWNSTNQFRLLWENTTASRLSLHCSGCWRDHGAVWTHFTVFNACLLHPHRTKRQWSFSSSLSWLLLDFRTLPSWPRGLKMEYWRSSTPDPNMSPVKLGRLELLRCLSKHRHLLPRLTEPTQ